MNHLGLAHYRFYLPLLACLLVFSTSLRAEIAIIVNPSNPLDTLSTHEVKKIFLGRARLFPGTDQAIAVLDQSRDNDIYKVFYTDVVGFGLNKLKRYRAAYLFSGKGKLPETVTNHEATKKKVSRHEGAIGYIDARLVDDTVKVVYEWPAQQARAN